MELYHWYKGTTRPTREGLCVVIWGCYGSLHRALCITVKPEYCQLYRFYSESGGTYIDPKQIIRWMPIEFPEEVS